jgi:tRNA U34 5-methylaminomethyl-2-thiouridine-forming methyltransferase MnmC
LNKIKIIVTEDGSQSLLNEDLQETYHSRHGALQESLHVFIKNGLHALPANRDSLPLEILEVGFGTGLNALLTCTEAISYKQATHYAALEPFPIHEAIRMQLKYPDPDQVFDRIHQATWEERVVIDPYFHLLKIKKSLQEVVLPDTVYDLVYFDAFAPSKQPDLWQLPVLSKVVESMKPGGVFVTYCAKGQLKRDLRSLGLRVESLPGPPAKKG